LIAVDVSKDEFHRVRQNYCVALFYVLTNSTHKRKHPLVLRRSTVLQL